MFIEHFLVLSIETDTGLMDKQDRQTFQGLYNLKGHTGYEPGDLGFVRAALSTVSHVVLSPSHQ